MVAEKKRVSQSEKSRGFGDSIAKLTKLFGIEPCGGCDQRRQTLNRLFPYQAAKVEESEKPKLAARRDLKNGFEASAEGSTNEVEAADLPNRFSVSPNNQNPIWTPRSPRFQIPNWRVHHDRLVEAYEHGYLGEESFKSAYAAMEGAAPIFDAQIAKILASTGGRRDPNRRGGPLDAEGRRRTERNDRRAGQSTKPAAGGTTPATFACGLDVTQKMVGAIDFTRKEFAKWSDKQKDKACQSITSWSTGDVAWDIIELHAQVTGDVINKGFRPTCATSGANPPCGSSVTVQNSCHFAGSANYVIFGVMCRLCNTFYEEQLQKTNSNVQRFADFVSSFSPRDILRKRRDDFSENGMLYLVDLYKKYIPLLKLDPIASNYHAAKAWSQAGFHGWPSGSSTPPGDRKNCRLTCGIQTTKNFTISWYPHLNPYQTR